MSAANVFNSLSSVFQNGLLIAGVEAPRGWTIEHGPGPAEFGVLGTPSFILFQGRKGNVCHYNRNGTGTQNFRGFGPSFKRV